MASPEIEKVIQLLARLPGLGPRSARRAALDLLQRRERLLLPLAEALREAGEKVLICSNCGNLDTQDPWAARFPPSMGADPNSSRYPSWPSARRPSR